jgi:hypothetical protein
MEFTPTEPANGDRHELQNEDGHELQESMFGHTADFPGHDIPEDAEDTADLERDDYSEPSLGEEREWETSEVRRHASGDIAETVAESEPEPHPQVPPPAGEAGIAAGAGPITLGDFAALEERVLRAVHLVRRERQARLAAEQNAEVLHGRVLALESELGQSQAISGQLEQLQQEADSLRAEREQVRQRVERLLGQLDALEI